MGFGPKANSVEAGVTAVRELILLLYPEQAEPEVLELFGETARALLSAKAPLSFETIQRFWSDAEWRAWLTSRWQEPLPGPWTGKEGVPVQPRDLHPVFGALIQDRLEAAQSFFDSATDPD